MSLPNGTVGTFLLVLTSKITQWDAKYGGPYSLGLMLEAANRVRDEVVNQIDSDRPDDLRKLQHAIQDNFSPMRWRDSVLKQIEEYITKGKLPTLAGKTRGRGKAGY